ncbi:cell wall metabolism sensor histidine kinase WalK [uncultured Treponema sp.]|uniref:sensor histidine kinase n=1 Tax=uncultured Treponema sp. TaxID=162155 RepID=UPI0025CD8DA0|nr:HAMP domain-containing sensor histidine kinase [uncultured Treponema sp.]
MPDFKFLKSFSARLALGFMFIMTSAVVLLSVLFLFFIRSLIYQNQSLELKSAESVVFGRFKENSAKADFRANKGSTLGAVEIPYYLTYIIYESDSKFLLSTNDPFLPPLEDTKGKARRFFQKNYFFDGDLDILYFANTHILNDQKIIVAIAMNMDNNTNEEIFSKLPRALLFTAIPILFLSFLISFFITKNTIKPVAKITKAAQSVTIENLSDLLPISGYDDEIDELSKTFNQLFLRLKRDFERERQFSSDVSHELNTPLTVISGQTGLLLRWGKENPEQLEKSLNAIKNEAKTMQAIIANLLQISRIESGRIKPQISEVSLDSLFSWLTEEFASVAQNLTIETESSNLTLNTDSEMLHQVLTILISNSLKYAGESCTIRISAKKQDNRITIEESDDGPGFSEKALPHIFERFYRADESHTRKIAGSGLGLAIAQTLCNALGAKIKARNMIPHGAGFTIEF